MNMNWELKKNVTDLVDSKLLAELGVMDGVEPDIYRNRDFDGNEILDHWGVAAYRLDKLLSKLPEWWREIGMIESGGELKRVLYSFIDKEVDAWAIRNACRDLLLSRGQKAVKVAVQLLKLLKEEELL